MERKRFVQLMMLGVVAGLVLPGLAVATRDAGVDPATKVQEEDLQREHPPKDLDAVQDFKVAASAYSTEDQLDAMRSTIEGLKRKASPEAVAKLHASVRRLKHAVRHQKHRVAVMHADLKRLHHALNHLHDPAVQHALTSSKPAKGSQPPLPKTVRRASKQHPVSHHDVPTPEASKGALVLADNTSVSAALPRKATSAGGQGRGGHKATKQPASNARTAQGLWKQVTLDVSSKDYGVAEQRLKAYLKRYPNGPKAADAYFWLGDLTMMQDRHQVAQAYFLTLVREAPLHRRAPDALLKLARLEHRLGRSAAAQAYARRCTTEYPKSTAAHVATVLLEHWTHQAAGLDHASTSTRAASQPADATASVKPSGVEASRSQQGRG